MYDLSNTDQFEFILVGKYSALDITHLVKEGVYWEYQQYERLQIIKKSTNSIGFSPNNTYNGSNVNRNGQFIEAPNALGATATQGFTPYIFPTVFDAIRSAQGTTPYTDLAQVQVTRKRAVGLGGGRIRTTLNFLTLITKETSLKIFDYSMEMY